jgi:two-component system, NarL family, response regulator LiaR
MENRSIRLVLADDQELSRQGIRSILESAADIEIVGEAHNGYEAQQLVAELQPNVLLLDLIMPDVRPYEVEEWVSIHYPLVTTLILTGHDRRRFLARAITRGVKGYLTKDQSGQQLIEAIRRAVAGEFVITDEQLEQAAKWQREAGNPWDKLTRKERLVLQHLSTGKSNGQIAEALGIKLKTVESHVRSILKTLGVASRSEAIAWIFQNFLDGLPW